MARPLTTLLTALALSLLAAASAQAFAPETVLRHLAGDADIALRACPAGMTSDADDGRILLCGRYEYGIGGFRMDVEYAAADLLAFGDWTADDGGTYTRSFLAEEARDSGLFHVGYHDGAVMLAFYPRGG